MPSLRNSALVTWMAPGARTRPLRCCAIRGPSSDSWRLRDGIISGYRVVAGRRHLQNFDKRITYIKNITIFVFVRSGWRVFKNMRIVQSHGRQHKEKRWCAPRCREA